MTSRVHHLIVASGRQKPDLLEPWLHQELFYIFRSEAAILHQNANSGTPSQRPVMWPQNVAIKNFFRRHLTNLLQGQFEQSNCSFFHSKLRILLWLNRSENFTESILALWHRFCKVRRSLRLNCDIFLKDSIDSSCCCFSRCLGLPQHREIVFQPALIHQTFHTVKPVVGVCSCCKYFAQTAIVWPKAICCHEAICSFVDHYTMHHTSISFRGLCHTNRFPVGST